MSTKRYATFAFCRTLGTVAWQTPDNGRKSTPWGEASAGVPFDQWALEAFGDLEKCEAALQYVKSVQGRGRLEEWVYEGGSLVSRRVVKAVWPR